MPFVMEGFIVPASAQNDKAESIILTFGTIQNDT